MVLNGQKYRFYPNAEQAERDCKVVLGHNEHRIAETSGFILHVAQAAVRIPDASHENVAPRTASAREPSQVGVGAVGGRRRAAPLEPAQCPPANVARFRQSPSRASASAGL